MTGPLEPLKIFISSPGDLAAERQAIQSAIENVAAEEGVRDRYSIEVVRYEDEKRPIPFDARIDMQTSVNYYRGTPADCALVIVMLWSRLGSPCTVDGKDYESGTAFEFWNAWEADPEPGLWLYECKRPTIILESGSDAAIDESADQLKRKRRFIEKAPSDNWLPFEDCAPFGQEIEKNFRTWIRRRLAGPNAAKAETRGIDGIDPAALFDALPTDHVPETHHEVPGDPQFPGRNFSFVGREAEFRKVAAAVKAGRTAAVVAGMGGVGKSQLAIEFAWRYGRFFAGGVEHLSFADGAAIPSEIARLGQALGLAPDFANLPLPEQERLMRAHWADGLPRLLIFDNCEDPDLLRAWRPNQYRTVVLVTCRLGDWPEDLGVNMIGLETLPRAESIRLLRGDRDDLDPAVLAEIADQLGDLPLALHLARRYLHEARGATNGRPDTFLARIRDEGALSHAAFAQDGAAPAGGLANVRAVFALSIDRLDAADPTDALARRLLAHAAYVAPGEPCPPFLLAGCVDLDLAQPADEDACHAALRRLAALGLCDVSDKSDWPSFHRLVQQAAQSEDAAAPETIANVILERAVQENASGLPGPMFVWQSHLRHIAELASQSNTKTSRDLLGAVDFHLDLIGDYQGSRAYAERALRVAEDVLPPDDPELAGRLNNLGATLRTLRDLAEARACFERAVGIDEAAFGLDHPKIAIRVNNLGLVLQDLGDLDEARACFERALGIDEAAFGPDHPEVATDVNNLGSVLRALGDLSEARACFERALGIVEAALGPDHPNVSIRVNNLGLVLHGLGDLDEARACFERALGIFQAALGGDHPITKRVADNLDRLLAKMDDA